MSNTTQWTQPRASGSSTIRASAAVSGGAPSQVRLGETSSPSQVKRCGISPPSPNAVDARRNVGSVIGTSCQAALIVAPPAASEKRRSAGSGFERLAIALGSHLDLEAEALVQRERARRVLGVDAEQRLVDAPLTQLDQGRPDQRTRESATTPP